MSDTQDALAEARRAEQYWAEKRAALEVQQPSAAAAQEYAVPPNQDGPGPKEAAIEIFNREVGDGATTETAMARVVAYMGGRAAAGDQRYIHQGAVPTVGGIPVE